METGMLTYEKTRVLQSGCQIHLAEMYTHSVSFIEHLIYPRSQDSMKNQLLTPAPSGSYWGRETQLSADAFLKIYSLQLWQGLCGGIRSAKSTEWDQGKANQTSGQKSRETTCFLELFSLMLLVYLEFFICFILVNIQYSLNSQVFTERETSVIISSYSLPEEMWPQRCICYSHGCQNLWEMGSTWRKISYWECGLGTSIGDLAPSCPFSPGHHEVNRHQLPHVPAIKNYAVTVLKPWRLWNQEPK